MKKKVLIINKKQFGYHTDSYKYCHYLKRDWDVTYYCFDIGEPKIVEDNVKTIYASFDGGYLKRWFYFLKGLKILMKKKNFDLVFIVNFEFCFLIRLFEKRSKYILDIRTGSVHKNKIRRFYQNWLIKFNSYFFKYITVISEGLAHQLKLKDYTLIPLGADEISSSRKDFKKLEMIYVGTLYNRNLHETVVGLKIHNDNSCNTAQLKYHIFGSGKKQDEELLLKTIKRCDLEDRVFFYGYRNHSEIKEYFDKCNVGVSYVPITGFYNHQPPTKTFEYILSGMACIATDIDANRQLISHENGLICQDSAESFAGALRKISDNKDKLKTEKIRASLNAFSWENIIKNSLEPFLQKV